MIVPAGGQDSEQRRLAALHEYGLLDAAAGDDLEAVVRLAALVAGVPTATLNLIDENRQCQLATAGFEGADSPRSESMCAIRFRSGEFVHVPDASLDDTYAASPWVTGTLAKVRFYASAPLITEGGHALGTLCVFDSEVRELNAAQIAGLQDLARVVLALFERRRQDRLNAELTAEADRRQRLTDTVLDTINVAVVAADPRGHLTLFNRAARDWHGLDADPSIDPHDFSDRYALFGADGSRLRAEQVPLLRALHDGTVDNAEMIIHRSGGEPVHVSASGRSLVAADGTLLGAVVAMHDVTGDRAHRHALQQAHAELAERSTQLAATVTELQRSNTELTHFAGAVSHDLVAPLAVVHGYLDLLHDMHGDDLDPQARKWVTNAANAVTRMQQLIESLLSYAGVGNAPCRTAPADLGDVLDQALMDLRGYIKDSGAHVTVTTALPTVACDATLIRQLLQNLLGNAMKYRHHERACRITITATAALDDNGQATSWTLAVADNGIGIPAEHRERVFDMFTQVTPDTRTGHGIGLATCQRIIERHGGRIWAAQTPGGGTTINFTLPTASP